MREIKFRAWDKRTKKMRKIDSFAFDDIDGNIKVMNLWGKDIIEDKDIILHREKNVELMQYTGLKDKNGKEIYEGDIVESQYFNSSTVRFKNGCFMFEDITSEDAESTYPDIEWEVIGNIYENPELLGK